MRSSSETEIEVDSGFAANPLDLDLNLDSVSISICSSLWAHTIHSYVIISTTLCREMRFSLEWDASVNPVKVEGENYEKNRGYRYWR